MLLPVEKLVKTLESSNFTVEIPKSEISLVTAEDESLVKLAPYGYYRFHYWKNRNTPKEHENYIYKGRITGPIVISLLKEYSASRRCQIYRVLIRSSLGWKAVLLQKESEGISGIHVSDKHLDSHQVIQIAMHMLIVDLMKASNSIFAEYTGDLSQNILNSSDLNESISTLVTQNSGLALLESIPSRNISISSAKSTLPREKFSPLKISRVRSSVSLANFSELKEDSATSVDKIRSLKTDFMKAAKRCSIVKDKAFLFKLLDIETQLIPTRYTIDFIMLSSRMEKIFHLLPNFGREISDFHHSDNLIDSFESLFLNDDESAMITIKADNIPQKSLTKLKNIVKEFIETENNCLNILILIKDVFINYMNSPEGKHLLKIQEFKEIFDGILPLITVHQGFIDLLPKDLDNDEALSRFIGALEIMISSKKFYVYKSFFTSFDKRMKSLTNILANNAKFKEFHDNCIYSHEKLDKKGLDQLLIAPIQRILRYSLLINEMIKAVSGSEIGNRLCLIYNQFKVVADFLNNAKKSSEQTEMLFKLQRSINNFPPNFLKSSRTYICQMACFLMNGGKDSRTRHTIYLFNDIIVVASKRLNAHECLLTHNFLFASDLKCIKLSKIKTDSGFNIALESEQNFDLIKNYGSIERLDHCIEWNSFIFSPKNLEKGENFLKTFHKVHSVLIAKESNAIIYSREIKEREVVTNVYTLENYMRWEQKNYMAIILCNEADDLDMVQRLLIDPRLNRVEVIFLVQILNEKMRFVGRMRDHQMQMLDIEYKQDQVHLKESEEFFEGIYDSIIATLSVINNIPDRNLQMTKKRNEALEALVDYYSKPSLTSGIRSVFSSILGKDQRYQSLKEELRTNQCALIRSVSRLSIDSLRGDF